MEYILLAIILTAPIALFKFYKEIKYIKIKYPLVNVNNEDNSNNFEYNKMDLELKSPCPICGQNEDPVTWCNVSNTGTYSLYGDEEFTCKPFMSKPCSYCDSQINLDNCITTYQLKEYINALLKLNKNFHNY